ncbi:transglutaminase family protein [Formosa sp. S-31]|uniref:transglutaminase family protein n=1 Tax=Formosa sp. S-31 TaxID=2790949 RepID=UPI003EB745E8
MIFDISHTTKYNYENGVSFCQNLATLKPKDFKGHRLLDYHLKISPTPVEQSERIDFFGNTITRFSIQQFHEELIVTAKSRVDRNYDLEIEDINMSSRKLVTVALAKKLLLSIEPDILEARQFSLLSPLISKIGSDIKSYAESSFKPDRPLYDAAFELMQRIYTDFDFVPGFSNIATPLDMVMKEKKGVCQDFAHIAIACMRSIGLPARYVSGYIETIPPPGKEKLVGTDASHAWFSVFIPTLGWFDFDPTNNQIPKNQHITVAHGRDYYDVPPLKGIIYTTGKNDMDVSVDIRPATNSLEIQK